MRLIDTWTFDLREFDEDVLPEYAILSHTWADGEVSWAEMQNDRDSAREKQGFTKIARAAELAEEEGLRWLWVDTCCIDKSSSAELQEAINSMWKWYSNAAICYALLSDLPRMPYITDEGAWRQPDKKRQLSIEGSSYLAVYEKFTGARWFSRGWCLQELIAPKRLLFYYLKPFGGKCKLIGDRNLLVKTISAATNIETAILEHKVPLSSMSVAQRMSWAAGRQTRRVEDQAYSLLGIFEIGLPMLYGEGKRAFVRLQEEIMRTNSDHSIFAWTSDSETPEGSLLAASPSSFAYASRIVQWGQPRPFQMTNRGLQVTLPMLFKVEDPHADNMGVLNCRYTHLLDHAIALRLSDRVGTNERHVVATTPEKPDAVNSTGERLALVHAKDVLLASPTDLLISRYFESHAASVRMMFHLDPTRGDRSHEYIKDVYTEQDVTVPRAEVFFTTRKPVARAGVMLEYPSGRQFSLVFGFDRYPPNDDNGVLLPGIWARFHRGPQKLKDIIKHESIHTHGRDSTCKDPRTYGCPYMPKSASVSLLPEGDFLNASIEHQHILDEEVFIVRANITQFHELGAASQDSPVSQGTPEYEARISQATSNPIPRSHDLVRYSSPDQASDSRTVVPENMHDPFVPDVRHSTFADLSEKPEMPNTSPPDSTASWQSHLRASVLDLHMPHGSPRLGPFHPEIQMQPHADLIAETLQSAGAANAFVPDVNVGTFSCDELEDFVIEEID